MRLLHKILNKLGRYRLILDRRTGADYMHRYYLFLKDRKKFPFNFVLHKIVKSDDPIFHDHPWEYITVVLKGGYWEHTPEFDNKGNIVRERRKWCGPGSIINRASKEFHWLELDKEKPVTTLFFMGRQERDWGFLVEDEGKHKWVKHDEYLIDWQEYHKQKVLSNK
jgi:hypothetical protein